MNAFKELVTPTNISVPVRESVRHHFRNSPQDGLPITSSAAIQKLTSSGRREIIIVLLLIISLSLPTKIEKRSSPIYVNAHAQARGE